MQEIKVTKELNQIETGHWVSIMTTMYGVISGKLIQQGEYIDRDLGKQKCYKILLCDERCVDLLEKEVSYICELSVLSIHDYYEKLKEKYEITCYDENEEFIGETELLKRIMNGTWDKFSDNEKYDFVRMLSPDCELITDILNAYSMSRKEVCDKSTKLSELADSRIKACNAVIDFQKKYDAISNFVPGCKWAYDFLYNYLGIDDLLKAI